jgi:hypothetical protein
MNIPTENFLDLPQMLLISNARFLSRKDILLTYTYSLTVAGINKKKL